MRLISSYSMAQSLASPPAHAHRRPGDRIDAGDDDDVRRLMAGFEQAIYGNAIKVLGGNIQMHAEGLPR